MKAEDAAWLTWAAGSGGYLFFCFTGWMLLNKLFIGEMARLYGIEQDSTLQTMTQERCKQAKKYLMVMQWFHGFSRRPVEGDDGDDANADTRERLEGCWGRCLEVLRKW